MSDLVDTVKLTQLCNALVKAGFEADRIEVTDSELTYKVNPPGKMMEKMLALHPAGGIKYPVIHAQADGFGRYRISCESVRGYTLWGTERKYKIVRSMVRRFTELNRILIEYTQDVLSALERADHALDDLRELPGFDDLMLYNGIDTAVYGYIECAVDLAPGKTLVLTVDVESRRLRNQIRPRLNGFTSPEELAELVTLCKQ